MTRFALKGVALAVACLWGGHAAALGLGRLNVQSALGETLRAEIDVTDITPEEAASLKLRVAGADAYRAAGVDYNAVLSSTRVRIVHRADGHAVLQLTSDRAVVEPFVDVIIEATWSSGRLVREYTMLFDPPGMRHAQAAPPAAAPVIAAAPQPAPAANPAPTAAPVPSPQRRSGLPRHNHAPVVAAAPANEVRVRSGDSLSRIANRTQQPGISLDQMLVSLFRGNPQAFSGDNMNRLKAGVLLTVPSAEQASKVSTPQAHSIIVAQAADFAAYRQRLAAGAPLAADNAPARQGRGQVQAQVADRKAEAAPTPDRLTLTQGGVKASSPEARVSKETQKQDEKARLAELNRNVEELKRLQGATAPAVVAASTTPAAPALAPAPLAAASATPSTLVAVPGPAPKPSAPLAASAPAKPKFAPPPPAAEEPGFLDSLMENSLLLPGLGVLAVLLGAFGIYKLRGRARKPVGETSFLESRLQPDSFFGASGGQRIDTREAGSSSNSSSMSYSLSQLDAIGDVDPVAEADVYLAYGRDLQAEEILKEAMRATPERLAIRSKLLEVYAKRRDAKAYELLATQLHNLTHGEGEEWSKAQALGLTIDPENPLYRPGGQPSAVHGAGGQVVPDALGAPTQPYTAPPPKPMFEPAADATLDHGLDLELDLPAAAAVPTTAKLAAGEVTQPFTTDALPPPESNLDLPLEPVDFDKTLPPPPFAAAPAADPGLDFDLESLNMPVDAPTVAMKRPEPEQDKVDFGDFSIGGEPLTSEPEPADHAPLARKIDLAEEFRQIGDLEGARDLLEEVIAKADGALKSKAQGMLDKLA